MVIRFPNTSPALAHELIDPILMYFTKPSVTHSILTDPLASGVLLSFGQMGRRLLILLNQASSTIPAISERAGGEHVGEGRLVA